MHNIPDERPCLPPGNVRRCSVPGVRSTRGRRGEGGVFDLLGPDAQWTIVGNSVVTGTYHSRE
jgi:hypothetical protein